MADTTETVILELEAQVNEAVSEFTAAFSQIEDQVNKLGSEFDSIMEGMKAKSTEAADHITKEGQRAGEGFRQGIEVALGTLGLAFIMAVRKAFGEAMALTEQFKTMSAVTGDSASK